MMVLVSYDVKTSDPGGPRRLRRISKECLNFGVRVQYSVFECDVDPAEWTDLRARLLSIIDEKVDSMRFYFLGSNWRKRVEHHGAKEPMDVFKDPLIM